MKIFIFLSLIFFISCETEVIYKDLSVAPNSKTSLKSLSSLNFNPQIEMMIVFLWPKDLGPKDENEVIEVISTSRDIAQKKEAYLKNLYKLQALYTQNDCDCHLVGLCEDDTEMNDDIMLICDDVTSAQDENNQVLASLTLDHELIKKQLSDLNAINIDVGVDDDYLDIGTFDNLSGAIHLNKFNYPGHQGQIDFFVKSYVEDELKGKFIFNIDKEQFTGDIGISNKEYNVIFSGEIETNTGQRGLIYWEHLK